MRFPFLRFGIYAALIEARAGDNRTDNFVVKEIIRHASKKMCFRIISHLILKDNAGYTHLIDHLVICNNGLFLITQSILKEESNIDITKRSWKYDEKDIPNSSLISTTNLDLVKGFLNDKYDINPLVVFLNNIIKENKTPNFINLSSLGEYLSTYQSKNKLEKEEIIKIYKSFVSYIKHQPSLEEHIDNMKRYHEYIKDNKCPYCLNKIELGDEPISCPKCSKTIY